MISYEVYKVLHLVGVVCVVAALGGVAVHAANGGQRQGNVVRRVVSALHGLGLLVILVAGFGQHDHHPVLASGEGDRILEGFGFSRVGLCRSGRAPWIHS